MFKVNNIIITGNIATNIDIKEIGNKILHKFVIAVDSSYKKDGEWINQADYIPIEYWNYTEKDITKGEHVGIIGNVKQSSWESDDGKKHNKIYIRALRLYKTQKEHYIDNNITEDDGVPF
jgi:single-stranded DNA-binding protein